MPSTWFPGHMQKARRVLADYLRLVDVVVEVLDARCPYASRNPEIDRLIGDRPRFIALNKADLAHRPTTEAWVEFLRGRGYRCGPTDGRSGQGVDALVRAVRDELLARPDRAPPELLSPAGRLRRQKTRVSMMLVGIPNVGKSSLLNRFGERGRAARGLVPVPDRNDPDLPKFGRVAHRHLRRMARTGALPGSTRGMQWVQVGKNLRLLDVPGILWPRQDDPGVVERLSFIGAVSPESINQEVVAVRLLQALAAITPGALRRYGLTMRVPPRLPGPQPLRADGGEPLLAPSERDVPLEVLDHVGEVKNWLLDNGRPDRLRTASQVLADFRSGEDGPISLEHPDQFGDRFAVQP